jgi:mannosylfructose-phosphate synthase
MANGTPTVITTEGGLWEQLTWGTETLYANPNDPEAFGYTMYEILAYPEIAQRLSECGAQRARASFTWTAITQKLLQDVMALGQPGTPHSRLNPLALSNEVMV